MSLEPGSSFRRIVTGHSPDNRANIASDGPPTRVFDNLGEAGLVFYEVWNTRETPARVDRVSQEPDETRLTLAPPPGGTRIRIIDIPPETAEANFDQVFESIGGADSHVDPSTRRHASFHRTQSIDYGIVLSGEITLAVDDGETVARAGDIIIQRGTNHGWLNRSGKPCRMAFVLIDGVFDEDLK